MSTTYLSPRSSTVMVDRTWAQTLGLNEIDSARRAGNFYRLPRVAYLRALQQLRDLPAGTAFEAPSVQVSVNPDLEVTGRRPLTPCPGAAGIATARTRRAKRERTPA